jgi:site-specific DNA-cytosine methylase
VKCVVINTYAGSLILGARAAGLDVEWSLEDTGYGYDIQRRNFPDVRCVPLTAQWPDLDLSDTVVLAHPPCSWASNTTFNVGRHGMEAAAFSCTRRAIEYALSRNAKVLALESVVQAIQVGRKVHDQYAQTYGYNLFRVVQDASHFGVPQARERAWFIYSREPELRLDFEPKRVCVRECMGHPGPYATKLVARLERQRKLLEGAGLPADEMLTGKHGFGRLYQILARWYGCLNADDRVQSVLTSKFASSAPQVLDPDGVATVLMAGVWFLYEGRNLTYGELNALMGFPPDYKIWPPSQHQEFLSRGVCPPVAEWIAQTVSRDAGHLTCKAGRTLDLRKVPK